MVEGAALEMLCGATHRGFESLSLRSKFITLLVLEGAPCKAAEGSSRAKIKEETQWQSSHS